MLKKKNVFILTTILMLVVFRTYATIYYVSSSGDDASNDGESEATAFASMTKATDVATGGDTIKICPGTYLSTDIGRFWDFNGTSSGLRVNVRVVDNGTDWPVVIQGSTNLEGGYADIRYIKFMKGNVSFSNSGIGIINVQGHTMVIAYCLIEGNSDDVVLDEVPTTSYDGIKILSKENYNPDVQNHDIIIRDCEIKFCSENPIDITGAKNCVFRDNDIHWSGSIQVKGGTLNCIFERNQIYSMSAGIIAGGMYDGSGYVGSPIQPNLAVVDRYNGKDILIRNNLFYNIKQEAISSSWINTRIYNNTIAKANILSQVIVLREDYITYYDSTALNSGEGISGSNAAGQYVKIYKGAKDTLFTNNILYNVNTTRNSVYGIKSDFMDGWDAHHNLYFGYSGASPQFRVGNTFYYGVSAFAVAGYEDTNSIAYENQLPGFTSPGSQDYSLSSGAYSIDKAYNFSWSIDDIKKNTRVDNDLGAYEEGSSK